MILQELPTANGTIIIRGSNTGINGITAEKDGNSRNIIDFLNEILEALYVDSYEDVIDKYEQKLETENLLEYSFPDISYTPVYLNKIIYETATYPGDTDLYNAVITEYTAVLDEITAKIQLFDTMVKEWYDSIANDPEKGKYEIFQDQ
ncbi:MAG: hypothetical protein LBR98_08295 [Syntrophomonadaceae bacterium]|jgi:hypothetical protein|nr:hypothetical protein [Syntrophomonadaceae bacterium]